MTNRGFTLIEIMVSLLILAGLSVLIAQSVKTGLESRAKVTTQVADEAILRDSMRLMVSDVAAAFHHRDYTVAAYNKVLELRKKNAEQKKAAGNQQQQPGDPLPPPTAATPLPNATPVSTDPLASATPLPEPKQLTGFLGGSDAVTFTVRNHVRRYFNSPDSDQAMVAYSLRSCRGEAKGGKESQSSCLVRLERTILDGNLELAPRDQDESSSVVLVQNVEAFKLRYIGREMTDFIDSWDSSTKSTNEKTKNNFPDAVEISLTLHDKNNPQSKPRTLTWLAPVRFPNNKDESDKDEEAKAAQQTGASPTATPRSGAK